MDRHIDPDGPHNAMHMRSLMATMNLSDGAKARVWLDGDRGATQGPADGKADFLSVERDRIAREIHDGPINEIVSASMQLTRLAADLPLDMRERIELVIDMHDTAVRQLRAVVFGLSQRDVARARPRLLVADAVAEATRCLGFAPDVHLRGDLDHLHDPSFVGHVIFSLREMLSNVARHAAAAHVIVSIDVGDEVQITVTDDGIGPGEFVTGGNGLRNLSERARTLGGTFELLQTNGGGTTAEWRAPGPGRR